MKRSDLKTNIKEKMLLEGLGGAGKTLLCMKITKLYALNGKKCLYIDVEHGTDREKEKIFNDLTDSQLENIDIVHATDINSLVRAMLGWEEEEQIGSQLIKREYYRDYDLKVVDDLTTEIDLYKARLTQKFIKQGKYEIQGTPFRIEDPDTFQLPFNFYAKIYDQLKESLVTMLNHRYDLIVCMHPIRSQKSGDAKEHLRNSIYMKFDSVVSMQKTLSPLGTPEWTATIIKNRGRESPDISNALDSHDPILIYFINKFGMPVEETLDRLNGVKKEE